MELHPECEQDELMKALTEVQSLAAEQLTTLSSHSIACVNVLHECQLLLESVCLRLMLERQSQIGVVDPRISGLHEADFVPCEARGPPAARSPSAKESLPPTSVWALARGRDGNKSCAAQTFLEDFLHLAQPTRSLTPWSPAAGPSSSMWTAPAEKPVETDRPSSVAAPLRADDLWKGADAVAAGAEEGEAAESDTAADALAAGAEEGEGAESDAAADALAASAEEGEAAGSDAAGAPPASETPSSTPAQSPIGPQAVGPEGLHAEEQTAEPSAQPFFSLFVAATEEVLSQAAPKHMDFARAPTAARDPAVADSTKRVLTSRREPAAADRGAAAAPTEGEVASADCGSSSGARGVSARPPARPPLCRPAGGADSSEESPREAGGGRAAPPAPAAAERPAPRHSGAGGEGEPEAGERGPPGPPGQPQRPPQLVLPKGRRLLVVGGHTGGGPALSAELLQAAGPGEEPRFSSGPTVFAASTQGSTQGKPFCVVEYLEAREAVLVWGDRGWHDLEILTLAPSVRSLGWAGCIPSLFPGKKDRSHTGFAMARLDAQRLLLAGGNNGASSLRQTGLLHVALSATDVRVELSHGPAMLAERNLAAAVGLGGGRVLVAGGTAWSPRGKRWLASTELLRGETMSFEEGPSMGTPRGHCAALSLDERRVLVLGGFDGRRRLASTELLDLDSMTFSPGPPLLEPRSGFAVAAVDPTHVLIIGGVGHMKRLASTEVLDVETMTFTPGPTMLGPRASCAAFCYDECWQVHACSRGDAAGAAGQTGPLYETEAHS